MRGRSDGSAYRDVLAVRDFRLLVAGSAASQLGDWLYNVALLVYVYEQTRSATWVAVATMVRLIPLVVLGPLGGVVADRYERVQVLVVGGALQWLLMSALTVVVALDGAAVWVILLAGLNTAAATPSRPAALATLPVVVGERGLAPANALLHTAQDIGVVGGPALGALILAIGDPVMAFGFNSVSFLASAVAFGAMRTRNPGVGAEAAPSPVALFLDGIRAVRDTPYVPVLTALTFFGAFTYGAQTVQLVVYVQDRLGLSSDGYGYLLAAFGAGGVLGATVSRRMAARSRIAAPLIVATIAFVGSQLLFAGTDLLGLAIVVGGLSGLGMVVADVVSETAITRAAPGDVMGRIFASYDAIAVGGMVLGAVVAAPLLHATSTRTSMVVLGAAAVVASLLCFPVLRRLDAVSAAAVEALAPRVAVLSRLVIFNGASVSALERLARGASELRVAAGTAVVQQGDVADAFYVCTDGVLDVTSAGETGGPQTPLRTLTAPAYFGEIGLIEGIPRTATVRATSDCALLRIDGAQFLDAFSEAPAGTVTLAEGVVRGLSRTHPSLAAAHARELLATLPPPATPVDDEGETLLARR